MEDQMKIARTKASILADALPYLRDFNQKIIVIGYLCSNILSGEEEQGIMQDVAWLKSVGMRPVLVHDSRMGADKFRENKRIAKLLEFCGVKAVGVCGIDEQTLHMTIENDYIPVITPNDIDTENLMIDPEDTAREIAIMLQAEKLIYLSKYEGVKWGPGGEKILSMKTSELRMYMNDQHPELELKKKLDNAIWALEEGVRRVHLIGGKMQHGLLLELFSVLGVGTVLMDDTGKLYDHEKGRR